MGFNLNCIPLLLSLTLNSQVPVQPSPQRLYERALYYLNKSVVRDPNFVQQCNDCCQAVIKPGLDTDLHVANRFIPNNEHLPLCDFMQKKYGFDGNCNQFLTNNRSTTVNHVRDSLQQFWKDYNMEPVESLTRTLSGMISDRKDGYQVFFSDLYRNTLAAEVKSFCMAYDKKIWTGGSISFFFVFDDQGDIREIYSGVVEHYN